MDGIMENQTCPTVGYQAASICVPVTVAPYANASATVGEAFVECLGSSAQEICTDCNIAPVDINPTADIKA